jgi:hypothetical protein
MQRPTILLLSILTLASCGEAPTEVEQAQPQALAFQCNDQPATTHDNAGTYDAVWATSLGAPWHSELFLGYSLINPGYLKGSLYCPQEYQANGCWTPWGVHWPDQGIDVYGQENGSSLQLTILPDQGVVFSDLIVFNLTQQQFPGGIWHITGPEYTFWDHENRGDTFDAIPRGGQNQNLVTGAPIACPAFGPSFLGTYDYVMTYNSAGATVHSTLNITQEGTGASEPYSKGTIKVPVPGTRATYNTYPIFGTATASGLNLIMDGRNPDGSTGPMWMVTNISTYTPLSLNGPVYTGPAHTLLPPTFTMKHLP